MTDVHPLIVHIGIDAGGSKTELVARFAGREETDVRLCGPAANLQRAGLEETTRVLAGLAQEALRRLPETSAVSVCAGVAGAGRPGDQAALAERVRRELGDDVSADVRVVHDGEIALEGAFDGASGLVVIAGTGSVVLARTAGGALARAGGWGYLLGDEGSGHALGQAGLQAVAAAHDGGPATRLGALLAERHGIVTSEDLVRHVYSEAWPVQRMAPIVVAAASAGDAVARSILQDQTARLAEQARWLAGRCSDVRPRFALLGGLIREAPYKTALAAALGEKLPGWRLEEPLHAPVYGALHLAARPAAPR